MMRNDGPLLISLSAEDRLQLKALAKREGLSMAALIRQRTFNPGHEADLLKLLAVVGDDLTVQIDRIDTNLARIRALREAAERAESTRRARQNLRLQE